MVHLGYCSNQYNFDYSNNNSCSKNVKSINFYFFNFYVFLFFIFNFFLHNLFKHYFLLKTMNKRKKKAIFSVIIRYIILLLVSIPNLWIFYFIFTPLTIYPVYFLLKLFFSVSLSGNILTFENCPSIELIKACIAGSAYYLLLILNLTTPIKLKKRLYSIIFLFSSFLIINIFRIFFFSILFLKSFSLFNTVHLFFWYLLSSLIVVLIWLFNIRIFKIKDIPIYSDFRNILKT